MKELELGKKYLINCYKHNGKRHRSWNEAVLLDIKEDYLVFGNNKTRVTDADGKIWYTKEPAIMYFYKNQWFNIIGQLKENGVFFYCNIASPFIMDENIIKYIDYDLDLRVYPNGAYKILDQGEYEYHKRIMNYPNSIDKILRYELNELINKNIENKNPFSKENIKYYYERYCQLKQD